MAFHSWYTQWWPPKPAPMTESNVPRQDGKVFFITGGNSGCGYELINILYPLGATIYLAARSKQKADDAIQAIKNNHKSAKNPSTLVYLSLDLNDLASVKAAAEQFAKEQSKLDVLWNNAGIGNAPVGTVTKQNIEGHIGVNCVGPLALTQYLLPQLKAAARTVPPGSVRVIWTSSWLVESQGPKNGMDFAELDMGGTKDPVRNYAASKTGNWLLAVETARRYGKDEILSVVQNPGNLTTGAWRYVSKLAMFVLKLFLFEAKYGGYTELWAGLSPELTMQDGGAYIIPWGRKHEDVPRKDILAAMEEKTGQSNVAERFWEWCDRKIKANS